MASPPQQFCVRWNSYHSNLQAVFPRLLLTEQFADVTLACESRQLRCHKLVLAACSAYLERLLLQNPCTHPIVLLRDMRFSEVQALVDFMYKGEVNVTQEELPSLLRSAEALQIRGLCSGEAAGPVDGAAPAAPAPAPVPAPPPPAAAPRPRLLAEREVKEETVEEDGLYYGELDDDRLDCDEEEDGGEGGVDGGAAHARGGPPYAEEDYYKRWLERSGELEVSLSRAGRGRGGGGAGAGGGRGGRGGPKPRRRGRPPAFPADAGALAAAALEADLAQFLEGKEVSSSGLARKDLERAMMGKFNPNRRYSNEAMWAALMDVKRGGSIYRAAQTHKVPRKSLRNWMKRCHIKSSFPMPQQLKQFVENSRRQRAAPPASSDDDGKPPPAGPPFAPAERLPAA